MESGRQPGRLPAGPAFPEGAAVSTKLPPGEAKRRKAVRRQRELARHGRTHYCDRRREPFATPSNERLNTDAEREFLRAIDEYIRAHDRPHPTCREVLAVAKSLGYRKVAPKES